MAGVGAERAEERLRVLTTAMRHFAEATTDVDRLLALVARHVAEVLGDSCVLLELTPDGTLLVPRAAHAVDPSAMVLVDALIAAEPFLLETHPAARAVIETRSALLLPLVDAATFAQRTTSAYLAFQRDLGIHSLLAVALHAHGRPLGLLTLTRYRKTSPSFDEDDRELAQTLADLAALSLANGRLYVNEREARLAAEEREELERLRAERAADARFRVFVEAAPDAIVIMDDEERIRLVNGQTEQLFGFDRRDLLGEPLARLFPVDAGGGELLLGRRKDGTVFPLELTVSTLVTDEGMRSVMSIRDVTERKEAERELVAAKEAAEAANKELEAFSYSVAHDLRAPIRGMHGFAQIVLDDHGAELGAEGERLLQRIIGSATKMGALVDGLLQLSRLTRVQLTFERVDLSEIVRSIAALAPREDLELVIADAVVASGDPALLRALLDNLVGNAVKFSSKTASPRVEIGRFERAGEEIFFVRDNGAGFDMRHAALLFAPFHRLHATTEYPGTGIGLATAERIVQRHGGRIWAESEVGKGATFFFTLVGPLPLMSSPPGHGIEVDHP